VKVVFATDARKDLREIGLYIGRDNLTRARTYVQELRVKAFEIAQTPLGFPLVPRYETSGIRR
jgi:toxin ParE1/3/4